MNFDCIDFMEFFVVVVAFFVLSCIGIVVFVDVFIFFLISWIWEFGDGNIFIEQNFIYIYDEFGIYDVQLEVCNENGCDIFFVSQVIIFDLESFVCINGISMFIYGLEMIMLCNGVLYDDGGFDGNYIEGSNGQFFIVFLGVMSIMVIFIVFDLGVVVINND